MAHFDDVATSEDKYLDCTTVKKRMQLLFDILMEFYTIEVAKGKEDEEV